MKTNYVVQRIRAVKMLPHLKDTIENDCFEGILAAASAEDIQSVLDAEGMMPEWAYMVLKHVSREKLPADLSPLWKAVAQDSEFSYALLYERNRLPADTRELWEAVARGAEWRDIDVSECVRLGYIPVTKNW